MARKGWMSKHTLEGTCPLCDEQLGLAPLTRRKGVWMHKACRLRQVGE